MSPGKVRSGFPNAVGHVGIAKLAVHPQEPLADETAYVLYLGGIAAPRNGILMHQAFHYRPAHEIQFLRLFQVFLLLIDKADKMAFVDAGFPGFPPDLQHLGFCFSVPYNDIIYE